MAKKCHALGEKDPAVKQAAREKYDADLADIVLADDPDIIICAGWMHVLSPKFLDPLAAKKVPIINLHPHSQANTMALMPLNGLTTIITKENWSMTGQE